ncbi:MAG TPA: insulinase family protein, partial [candidate division WOR-3 bacterium]|nr:insulinase family protein [candidate division WOR-3 bacterium]
KSSILMRKLVYEREVFSGITAENYALKDPGLFVIYGSPVNGMDVEKAEQELDRILIELKDLITEEDIEVAKNKALTDFIFGQESVKNVGFSLGEFEILDRAECINLFPEKIMKIQLEDIKMAIDQYLVRKTRNVAILKVKK